MRRIACLAALLCVLAACKDRGVIDAQLSFPADCRPFTHAGVYLIRGGTCDECECGDCLRTCRADNCEIGCGGSYCTAAEYERGITVEPSVAGAYAVVYQLVTISDDGAVEEVATACVDAVQVDRDGTESDTFVVTGTCCPGAAQPLDAGPSDAQ